WGALLSEGPLAAHGPAQRQLHGAARLLGRSRKRDALVELHLNVTAEQALNFYGPLRGEHVVRSVHVRPECYPLLGDLPQSGERHDLKAAGVSQDGSRPAHERVQTAKPGDAFRRGAQHQVISVGENNVRARLARSEEHTSE